MPFISDSYKIDVKTSKKNANGLRDWQIEATKALAGAQYTFCTAPCGSGKSTLQVALAAREIIDNHHQQKQLIVIPQSHISESFRNHKVKVGSRWYQWTVAPENVYADASQTVSRLKQWLLTSPKKLLGPNPDYKALSGITAICSYASLVMAFTDMTDAEKKKAYRNLSLRIDEAHHINGLFDDGEEEGDTAVLNGLSTVCYGALNGLSAKTTRLHLTTATPMRGDHQFIVTDKLKEKFVRYDLTWDKWLPELGIDKLNIVYEDYRNQKQLFEKVVAQAEKDLEEGRNIWIMIPSTGSEWRRTFATYQKLVTELNKIKKAVVLDLVPSEGRDASELYNLDAPHNITITCAFGLEGTDWVKCDTVYNLCVDGSITRVLQKWGRPLRKTDHKTSVHLLNFVCFPQEVEGMTISELFNSRVNAIMASMLLGDAVYGGPIGKIGVEDLKTGVTDYVKGASSGWSGTSKKDWRELLQKRLLKKGMLIDNAESLISVMERMSESTLFGTFDEASIKKLSSRVFLRTPEEWVPVAEKLEKENGVLQNQKWLKTNGFSGLVHVMRSHPALFEHIKQKKGKNTEGKSPKKWVPVAEKLEKENGVLQNPKWLTNNGYRGLADAMRARPELFKHIKQNKKPEGKTIEEWLVIAEKLEKENGVLQNLRWLAANGYSGLVRAMRIRPDLFEHIKQLKLINRSSE